MRDGAVKKCGAVALAGVAAVLLLAVPAMHAHEPTGRAVAAQPPVTPLTAQAAAPIDLTGYWVSIVSEDWRWRMGVGQKGDFGYIPLNAAGRLAGNAWDSEADTAAGNHCKAYGAAAIMRVPARFHITWANDSTLKIDVDNGSQTRLLHFGGTAPAGLESTWQGYSVANWEVFPVRGRQAAPRTGELKVVTTKMRSGYYFKHGVPYSENAMLTEFFARLSDNGDEYLAITTIVDDPTYLAQPFVRTLQFRREPDGSKWNPAPCE